jgi:iron(III) transport system permease protein
MALSNAAAGPARLRAGAALSWGPILTAGAALICAAPTLGVVVGALQGPWAPALEPSFIRLTWESAVGLLLLLLLGGGGATLIGVSTAWLVSMARFPGARLFEWLLILPLATPAYVLAYAYGGIAGPTGPVPIGISGLFGAAFVYALCFYPYVYLAARAAFLTQSVCALEAARSLGASPWQSFWRVALPMARPGIAAGMALAMMEIAADYGAAAYFGAQTMTTGVFRAWFSLGAPDLALKLALLMLGAAVLLLALERGNRGQAGFAGGSARWRALPRFELAGPWAWTATTACGMVFVLATLAPLAWLARLAAMRPLEDLAALATPLANTLMLAFFGAALTLLLAVPIAMAARRAGPLSRLALLAAAAGYAAPGAVIALGALFGLSFARDAGVALNLTGAVAFVALFWTYAARFAAAGAQPLEAGLSRVTANMSGAAATLGASPARRFLKVELPIAAPSALAAGLIVFVEIMRELPATLILRPFNFETLAVKAHAYASDDRLAAAAGPALLITLAGLAPMILVARGMTRARAGA